MNNPDSDTSVFFKPTNAQLAVLQIVASSATSDIAARQISVGNKYRAATNKLIELQYLQFDDRGDIFVTPAGVTILDQYPLQTESFFTLLKQLLK